MIPSLLYASFMLCNHIISCLISSKLCQPPNQASHQPKFSQGIPPCKILSLSSLLHIRKLRPWTIKLPSSRRFSSFLLRTLTWLFLPLPHAHHPLVIRHVSSKDNSTQSKPDTICLDHPWYQRPFLQSYRYPPHSIHTHCRDFNGVILSSLFLYHSELVFEPHDFSRRSSIIYIKYQYNQT